MSDYELLDSGDGRKLERLGPYVLDRPSPQAVWCRSQGSKLWRTAHGYYHRSVSGGGHWEWPRPTPEQWTVTVGGLLFTAKPTGFGHVGLFFEQVPLWPRFAALAGSSEGRPLKVLNLFAYTGAATVACAAAGAAVTHVDASKGVVQWARENAALQKPPVEARWMVDDVADFLAREVRRGNTYDGALLDPPSYGRGGKGRIFKIEEHLRPLLADLRRLLPDPRFLFLSCHTPGYTPMVLQHLLDDMGLPGREAEAGEMVVRAPKARDLPSGTYVLWTRPPR